MKNILTFLMLGIAIFATSCAEDETPSLTGSKSTPGFTYTLKQTPGGDTLPFTTEVIFTNTSTEAFTYFWDFGDNGKATIANPTHTYTTSGNFIVKLTSLGKAGNATFTQQITIGGPCEYAPFSALTGCSNRSWSMSPVADAIRILSPDGNTQLFSGPGAACQTDDAYTFFTDGTFRYDAKDQTFVANEGAAPYSCQAAQANAVKFMMIKNTAGNPRIILNNTGMTRNPFIGTTDVVNGNSYEVISASENELVLQGVLADGNLLRMKFINGFSINTIKLFLHGGGTKTWMLDTTAGANAVTAGLEANPTQYYSGGPLAPCQKDDYYTFTSTDNLTVDCSGSTLLPPAFECGADKSFTSSYSFGGVVGSVAGIAQISLTPNTPTQWIGVFDRAPENVYRIISISGNSMVLRSGNGSPNGVVHDMKFVVRR
jgi:PKD repeat protein